MLLSTGFRHYEPRYGERSFEKIKENGYNACDYPLNVYKNPLHTEDAPSFSALVSRYETHSKLAKQHGINVQQTHAGFYTSLDCYDDEYIQAYVACTKNLLYFSKLLGAKYLVVHPVQPYAWNEDLEPERTEALNVDVLKRLSEKAEEEGVILALENMPALFQSVPCNTPEQVLRILEKVNSPFVKICFDSGHANMAKNFRRDGKILTCADYVRAFGDKIVCLHLHENNGKLDQHNMLNTTPSGAPDREELFRAFKEIGYDGSYNSEADFSPRLPAPLFDEGEKLQAKLLRYYAETFAL